MNMAINLDVNLDLLQNPPAEEYVPYRVAVCWSSSQPDMKVLHLATGVREILNTERHKSFIRWASEDTPAVVESNMRVA
jgi:hypothetical protein